MGDTAFSGRLRGILFAAVGFAVLGVALYLIGVRRIVEAFQQASPAWVALSALFIVAGLWVRVWKWRIALGPGAQAMGLFFASKGAGEWTPGRVGEFAPLMLREHRSVRLGAWILLDRFLEIGATLGLGALGLVAMPLANRAAILAVFAGLCALLALFVVAMGHPRFFEGLATRSPDGSRRQRLWQFAVQLANDIRLFNAKAPITITLTVLGGCLDVWGGMALFAAFGIAVPFTALAVARGVHAVVSSVPFTPNATGIPYITAAVILRELAGVPDNVLAAGMTLSAGVTTLIFWGSFAIGIGGMRNKQQ